MPRKKSRQESTWEVGSGMGLHLVRPGSPLQPRCVGAELAGVPGGVRTRGPRGPPRRPGRESSGKKWLLLLHPQPFSEFLCPSDRAAISSRDGGANPISSTDRSGAAAAPPLGLLPSPRRAQVAGVSNARHVEVGGFACSFPGRRESLQTRDPGPLQVSAKGVK